MKNRRFVLPLLLMLLLLAGGCKAFREAFSRRDPHLDRSAPARSRKKTEGKTSSGTGDDLFDVIFSEKRGLPGSSSGMLSRKEQETLQQTAPPRRLQDDPDARALRDQMKKGTQKRKDWVFETQDGSYFQGGR